MKHVYFNELTLMVPDEEIIRRLGVFLDEWKALSSSLSLKNRLFILPESIRLLLSAVDNLGSRKVKTFTKQSLASFLLGTFHPKRLPIDDEPDAVPGSQDRFCASVWNIETELGGATSCLMLAWSHVQGSITIGFDVGGMRTDPVVKITETTPEGRVIPRTAVCVSRTEHLSDPVVRRWSFSFLPRVSDSDDPGFSYAEQGHKHFKLSHVSESKSRSEAWVDSTRSPGAALFRPGLHETSHEVEYLVRLALSHAFESGRYTAEEQNRFVFDTHSFVGAAEGKQTSRIELYLTPQNQLHIRPKE